MNAVKDKVFDVMFPKFAKEFACIGSDCPTPCCHSWDITVDKQAFKKLKKHGDIEIREIAQTQLKLTRNSDANYGQIKLLDDGTCAFLNKDQLCTVQLKGSHEDIPHTCQDYPRLPKFFGEQIEQSMSLSCYAISESVLFDPEAFLISVEKRKAKEMNHGNISGSITTIPWMPILRDFCFAVAIEKSINFELRLFIIGMLLKQAEPFLNDPTRLQELVNNFYDMIADNTLQTHFEAIPAAPSLKWQFFAMLDSCIMGGVMLETKSVKLKMKELGRFIACQQQLMASLNAENLAEISLDAESVSLNFCNPKASPDLYQKMMQEADEKHLNKYYQQHPEIFDNYLLYRLYTDQFLHAKGKTPFQFFKILMADIIVMKSYLAGISMQQKGLTKEWVLQLFESYNRKRQHLHAYDSALEDQLNKVESENPMLVFTLLK